MIYQINSYTTTTSTTITTNRNRNRNSNSNSNNMVLLATCGFKNQIPEQQPVTAAKLPNSTPQPSSDINKICYNI